MTISAISQASKNNVIIIGIVLLIAKSAKMTNGSHENVITTNGISMFFNAIVLSVLFCKTPIPLIKQNKDKPKIVEGNGRPNIRRAIAKP